MPLCRTRCSWGCLGLLKEQYDCSSSQDHRILPWETCSASRALPISIQCLGQPNHACPGCPNQGRLLASIQMEYLALGRGLGRCAAFAGRAGFFRMWAFWPWDVCQWRLIMQSLLSRWFVPLGHQARCTFVEWFSPSLESICLLAVVCSGTNCVRPTVGM